MTDTNESDKCQKERERRRKRYKFALVKWGDEGKWGHYPRIAIKHKDVLNEWYMSDYTILCDDQPEKVLRAMLRMMENEDEI